MDYDRGHFNLFENEAPSNRADNHLDVASPSKVYSSSRINLFLLPFGCTTALRVVVPRAEMRTIACRSFSSFCWKTIVGCSRGLGVEY
jgi:hypothetical protein